jgi:4-amino-4-deoxy-L-arabinose transferase-like glycosyltransferase
MSAPASVRVPPAAGSRPDQSERRPRFTRARRALGRFPRACLACAAIAFVNSGLWAIITPSFQVPDEGAHAGYVQYVGEWWDIPGGPQRRPGILSEEMGIAGSAVPFSIEGKPTWFEHDVRGLDRSLGGADRHPGSVPAQAFNNPPLYYLLAAVPYTLAKSANFFDLFLVLRLFSALLAAITVAFTFLFVREILPGDSWTPRVAALAVAFQPMFGFMSGGINNDNLLYACGAALIYLLARALRRGLTPWLGVAIGGVAAAGMLTKTSFAGLLPGAALGLLLATWRSAPRLRPALVGLAAAVAAGAIPYGAWLLANKGLFQRPTSTTTAGFNVPSLSEVTSFSGQLSYLWQVFLPPLPHMGHFKVLANSYPLWDTYIQGFVGRFGWWRFAFPEWVDWLALTVYVSVLGLAATALARARAALRARWPELLTYAALIGGFVLLVEIASYRYQTVNGGQFEQTRYLFPLIAFYGALVALAARGAGRRWGQAVGAFLVVLAMGHSLFAMLLVVSHYYA